MSYKNENLLYKMIIIISREVSYTIKLHVSINPKVKSKINEVKVFKEFYFNGKVVKVLICMIL